MANIPLAGKTLALESIGVEPIENWPAIRSSASWQSPALLRQRLRMVEAAGVEADLDTPQLFVQAEDIIGHSV
jgi:hypothetical protein